MIAAVSRGVIPVDTAGFAADCETTAALSVEFDWHATMPETRITNASDFNMIKV
ncbi:hypothetical protein [Mucilaginibacter lappiensis]|uniref:hypothetical protein n=1 Tax=Mucilaginibacter lappiensis TaxID=354630 RepID=UPI0029371933|nr:hypothetical protein [Mucilaginibacter lappiensis]